jgi:hypothetical protein
MSAMDAVYVLAGIAIFALLLAVIWAIDRI